MFANDGCHVSWLGTNTIYFCLPKSVLTLSGNVASGVSKKAESMDFMYFMPSLFAKSMLRASLNDKKSIFLSISFALVQKICCNMFRGLNGPIERE